MSLTESENLQREPSGANGLKAGDERLRRYSTIELFGPDVELIIDHNGQRYRLRITRQGKLILTK